MEESVTKEGSREPTIEDTHFKLMKIASIVDNIEDRLEQIHKILDKDINAGISPRVADSAETVVPNLRFDMLAIARDVEKRLYSVCDNLGSLKFKLRKKA